MALLTELPLFERGHHLKSVLVQSVLGGYASLLLEQDKRPRQRPQQFAPLKSVSISLTHMITEPKCKEMPMHFCNMGFESMSAWTAGSELTAQ
eukprot:scaffold299064_cov15-Tisochrysis_lutea.AAC.1